MKVKNLFFSFPSCDGWFQPKVLSLPVKKISTVILINKCLDLAVATLMLERKKFTLHSVGFFSQGSERVRLGESSCHSCIKKRDLLLDITSHCFLHFTGKTGAPTEAGLRKTMGKLWMTYEAAKCSEKGRKWANLSYWPPVLASLFPCACSMVLWPGWCAHMELWAEINPQTSKCLLAETDAHSPGMACRVSEVQEFLVAAFVYYMSQSGPWTFSFLQTVAPHSEELFYYPLQTAAASMTGHQGMH